jgi:hypothetical protein
MEYTQIKNSIDRQREFIKMELDFIESRQNRLAAEMAANDLNFEMIESQRRQIINSVSEIKRYADKIEKIMGQI